jgi:hypothetical protein
VTELEAEALLGDLLRGAGWVVTRQLELGGRRVDIAAARGDQAIAVELKLKEWRIALSQAYLNRAYFDGSYLAVPRTRLATAPLSNILELGIGLMVFDRVSFDVVVDPVAHLPTSRPRMAGIGVPG